MSDPFPLSYATPAPGIPSALKVVAWLFIISGILTVVQILIDLTQGKLTINTGILGIFVGRGLLRFSPGWRTCALVLLWLGMIFMPIGFFFYLSAKGGLANIDVFGLHIGTAPMLFVLLLSIFFFGVTVWEYRVLVREDIRQRFGLPAKG